MKFPAFVFRKYLYYFFYTRFFFSFIEYITTRRVLIRPGLMFETDCAILFSLLTICKHGLHGQRCARIVPLVFGAKREYPKPPGVDGKLNTSVRSSWQGEEAGEGKLHYKKKIPNIIAGTLVVIRRVVTVY